MDVITIKELKIFAYHGVFEEEKNRGQNFYVNGILKTDLKKAAMSDQLGDSTHYGEVCLQIKESMTKENFDLIEKAAEKAIEDILCRFPLVQEVTLEVRKPEAPIPMEFQSVSVTLTRGWHKTYIAFGSNMGDREKIIEKAIQSFRDSRFFRKLNVSDFFYSTPYGGVEQEDFVNGVLEVETMLEPEELLAFLQQEESRAERVRGKHWGPRTLDLDILLYEDLVFDGKTLQIPHKDMKNRDFVLVPLAQLAGYVRHPLYHITIDEMVQELKEFHITEQEGKR